MLGALYARPKILHFTASPVAYSATHHRIIAKSISFANGENHPVHHSTACQLGRVGDGTAASIWHMLLPTGGDCNNLKSAFDHHEHKGEGSWNVAWDVRPARWLRRSNSEWLLFGVCSCLVPSDCCAEKHVAMLDCCAENLVALLDCCAQNVEATVVANGGSSNSFEEEIRSASARNYKVTGVPADGRCLFRAVSYGVCLRSGGESPDENRQRELADDLRARVVDELLKRREETKWFIEGDFDAYLKSIKQPNTWGGEPELLMATHVLKTPISVYTMNTSSRDLIKVTSYGEEYEGNEIPIKVLFHGYGHYDLLETF